MNPKNVQILKCRDDKAPVFLTPVSTDCKAAAAFTLAEGSTSSWLSTDELVGPDKLRPRIEPWLTALFQSVHFSFLVGFGITHAIWPRNAATAEYARLQDEYYRVWDALFTQKLEEFGEQQMAQFFREDRPRFDELSEQGQQFFYGPESASECCPSLWLDRLVRTVTESTLADGPMGPLGCRWREEDDFWEVEVYPTPVELVGGAVDGEVVAPGFTLDVEQLRAAFDRIEALEWQSLGLPGDEGPRLVIEGIYQGQGVFLQVLAYAPFRLEPPVPSLAYNPPERVRGVLLGYFGDAAKPSHVIAVVGLSEVTRIDNFFAKDKMNVELRGARGCEVPVTR